MDAEPTTAAPQLRPPRHRACERAKRYWAVSALIGWAVALALAIGVLGVVIGVGWGLVAGLAVLIVLAAAAHATVMPRWRYAWHRWEATDHAVYTQSGWLDQERRIAPISRIQTVDSEQGPLQRVFRLADVTVTTASAAGPLKIEGLDASDARALVDELTAVAQAEPGDAT